MKSRKNKQRIPVYITYNSGNKELKWAEDILAAQKIRDLYLKMGTCKIEIGVWK